MLVCCFDDVAKEAHAKSPVDTEVAAESFILADDNLLSVCFPCIDIRGSSEFEFRCGCWIL